MFLYFLFIIIPFDYFVLYFYYVRIVSADFAKLALYSVLSG